jgi:hypothetical protein
MCWHIVSVVNYEREDEFYLVETRAHHLGCIGNRVKLYADHSVSFAALENRVDSNDSMSLRPYVGNRVKLV